MKILTSMLILLCGISCVHGQIISRREADSLIKSVKVTQTSEAYANQLLRLAEFNIFKPGDFKSDLDSATMYMHEASKLNATIKSLQVNGYLQLLAGFFNKEIGVNPYVHFKEAINNLKFTKDNFHLLLAELELSKSFSPNLDTTLIQKKALINSAERHLRQVEDPEQKLFGLDELKYNVSFTSINDLEWKSNILQKMQFMASKMSDPVALLTVQTAIVSLHIKQENYGLAIIELNNLLPEYRKNKFPRTWYLNYLLSNAFYFQGNYEKAIQNSLLGITDILTKEPGNVYMFYNNLSLIYIRLNRNDKARQWLEKVMDVSISFKKWDLMFKTTPLIVDCFIREKNPTGALNYVLDIERRHPTEISGEKKNLASALAKCYIALGRNDVAKGYILKMIKFSEIQIANGEIPTDNPTDVQTCRFYLTNGQFHTGEKYLTKSLKSWPANQEVGKLLFEYEIRFKLDSASRNYFAAMKQLQKTQKFKDSTFTAIKSRQIEELDISYETERKKRDIKILEGKQKLQEVKLLQIENTKNYIIAGSGMLLLLLAVIYNRYRLKQRSNRLLQQKQEEIKMINAGLEKAITHKDHLLTEKEWLLKEVHHRVKNNLHTVICLLESQAAYLENDALKAIENSQHRIYAMSLIHQKLYQSDDIKTIDMSLYLPEFIQYLNDSFGTQRNVHFHLQVEPILLGVSQAIPLALIVNEAVTNSIKYAFAPGFTGVISISMFQTNQEITLIIADNGRGIDPAIANMPLESLGLKLMNGLSEDINAHIKFENIKGTKITIIFNFDPLNAEQELQAISGDI
ncbi:MULTISPECIES: histidine kinase dimerization/phosphoacceptor domain -containing protein [unclassified Mucilaginibacter]|uniref:tetratricopeptide repeat-containing sensor histidine kinase n=1 Tax=unclassified Mucilaginibacter TaxID=2617802 RepID=UPI003398D39E